MNSNRKGFTLVELLIVIGILAVLATVIVLVLNPAELFKQARDSRRMGDLQTVSRAVTFYLTTATTPALTAGPFSTASTTCGMTACTVRAIYAVDGTGWVAAVLTDATGGSPLGTLPQDPTNSGLNQYSYNASSTALTFELDTQLESTKYRGNMTTDGGDDNTCTTYLENTCYYEVGTDPGLNL